MKNTGKLLGIIALITTIGLLLSCGDPLDENGNYENDNHIDNSFITGNATLRYCTIPYEVPGELGTLKYYAHDNDNNYYLFVLGHISRVPIAYQQAVIYNGITAMTIGYERTHSEETSIMNAITTTEINTITNSSHFEWSVKGKAGFEVGPFSTSVEARTGGSNSWDETNTRSVSDTVETTISRLNQEKNTISATIGNNNEPVGLYRYALFGTIDVYYVLITDRNKTQVKEAYTAMCARPVFAWGIDYEPDLGGSFGKTDDSNLLTIPVLNLSSLPNPSIQVDDANIPMPDRVKKPEADLSSGVIGITQTVTLDCEEGAEIRYTLDGSTPTESSMLFTSPIIISQTTILKAIAIKTGMTNSSVFEAKYHFLEPKDRLSAGQDHTLFIDNNGNLWVWGDNERGQLGQGDNTGDNKRKTTPVKVDGTYISVAAGDFHSLAIDIENNLYAWGAGGNGRLGNGQTVNLLSPRPIRLGTKFMAISGGSEHSLAIDIENNLYAWGAGGNGRLGTGNTSEQRSPVLISSIKAKAISAGWYHSLVLDINDNLLVCGSNTYGQVGDNTKTQRNSFVEVSGNRKYNSISAGAYHNLAIDTNNNLWAWGSNSHGRLGDGTNIERTVPVQIGTENYIAISATRYGSLAINTNNEIWAWGDNEYRQIGDGTNANRSFPVTTNRPDLKSNAVSGFSHSLAVDLQGRIWSWGRGNNAQHGQGNTSNLSTPTLVNIPLN